MRSKISESDNRSQEIASYISSVIENDENKLLDDKYISWGVFESPKNKSAFDVYFSFSMYERKNTLAKLKNRIINLLKDVSKMRIYTKRDFFVEKDDYGFNMRVIYFTVK